MKKLLKMMLSAVLVLEVGTINKIPLHAEAVDQVRVMYRLYNPNSGEHFYTSDYAERNHTIDAGWRFEGVGWRAPGNGNPVYRLYNANGGEHHYTLSRKERNHLIAAGWKYEGIGWASDGSIPVYREYNPNAFSCNHNYTTSQKEHQELIRLGWKDEGIGWYATEPDPVSIENDNQATVSISADIDMKGSGDGYHSKVVINSANGSLASFGVQHDTDRYGKAETRFIMENIMNHAAQPGPVGKRYLYAGNAEKGKKYNIRLSWYRDTNELVGYVDGIEVIRDRTTFDILTGRSQNFALAVEGCVKHTGDTIDAVYDHIKARSSIDQKTGGLLYGWRDDVPNYHREKNGLHIQLINRGKGISGGVFDTGASNSGYDASMHVYGRGDDRINGHDWDWVEFYADAAWTTHAKLPGQATSPQTRTVIFDPNSTEATVEPKTMKPVVNHAVGKLPAPVRSGYQFGGWYTIADPLLMDDLHVFTDSTIVSDDITVYAKWEPKTTAQITFDRNCEDSTVAVPETQNISVSQPVGSLPLLQREGYVFDGWMDKDGNMITSDTVFQDDAVLYAHWSVRQISS